MENILVGAVLLLIVGIAIAYVVRSKKKGKKCIGCPYCDSCPSKNKSSSCGHSADDS